MRALAAPVLACLLAFAPGHAAATGTAPATGPAARVLEILGSVHRRIRTTRYQHRTEVREARGLYAWDCSGMAEWILDRAAPAAREAVPGERPVARDFFRTIDRAPIERPRRGWQRLARIAEARPGDVFAWLRPPDWPRGITGHVGFVVGPPEHVAGLPGGWLLRIADSTSYPHQDDSRSADGPGGFGIGRILFIEDARGEITAYGWTGVTLWSGVIPVVSTRVVFGRLHR